MSIVTHYVWEWDREGEVRERHEGVTHTQAERGGSRPLHTIMNLNSLNALCFNSLLVTGLAHPSPRILSTFSPLYRPTLWGCMRFSWDMCEQVSPHIAKTVANLCRHLEKDRIWRTCVGLWLRGDMAGDLVVGMLYNLLLPLLLLAGELILFLLPFPDSYGISGSSELTEKRPCSQRACLQHLILVITCPVEKPKTVQHFGI